MKVDKKFTEQSSLKENIVKIQAENGTNLRLNDNNKTAFYKINMLHVIN